MKNNIEGLNKYKTLDTIAHYITIVLFVFVIGLIGWILGGGIPNGYESLCLALIADIILGRYEGNKI